MDTNVTHEALRAAHALSGGFRPLMEVSKLAAIIDREAHIPDLLAEVERLREALRFMFSKVTKLADTGTKKGMADYLLCIDVAKPFLNVAAQPKTNDTIGPA